MKGNGRLYNIYCELSCSLQFMTSYSEFKTLQQFLAEIGLEMSGFCFEVKGWFRGGNDMTYRFRR